MIYQPKEDSYLLEKEVIFSEDLEKVFGKRPFEGKNDHIENNDESVKTKPPKQKKSQPKENQSIKS